MDKLKGSQSEKIKAIMSGSYASMINEQTSSRLNGALFGAVGGIILGTFLRQNSIITGLVGGVVGYVVSNKNK